MKLQLSKRSFRHLLAWSQCLSLVILPLLSLSINGFAESWTSASSQNLVTQEPQLLSTIGILFVVNSTGDDDDAATGNGVCETAPGNGICTLRAAIEETNAVVGDDGIRISISGCPGGMCTINLNGVLPEITDGVFITGPGADKLTVRRDTGGAYRIFRVTATDAVTFSGITISNGLANCDEGGGGIQNFGSGTVNVINSAISGNSTGHCGGDLGGGIRNHSGTLNISNSTISDNSSVIAGGGIENFDGEGLPTGTVNITNSTISRNSDSFLGGGGIDNKGTLNVTNSTISHNSSNGSDVGGGGGIKNGGTVHVKSSIIALNTASNPGPPDVAGSFTSDGFNLIGKTDGSTGFTQPTDQTGTVAAPLDPRLNGLQNNGGPTKTVAFQPDSPAIDKGIGDGLASDQRGNGFARTFNNPAIPPATGGDNTDIGAFELQTSTLGTLFVVNSTDDDDDAATGNGVCETAPGNGKCTLRAAIEETNAVVGDDGIRFNIPGCPAGVCTINLNRALPYLSDGVFITGPGADRLTVQRDGNSAGSYRIFNVITTGTVSISAMTISNGLAPVTENGGGIQNFSTGTVDVNNCTLRSNRTDFSFPNVPGSGGGISNSGGGTVNVTNSSLSDNSGNAGGGIYNYFGGTVNISNSAIGNNHAIAGGGFYNNGDLNITNSTISGNGNGGGIVQNGGVLNVTNSTISDNFYTDTAAGIYNSNGGGTVNVKSTIIALNRTGNSDSDVAGSFISQGFNLVGNADGSTGFSQPTDQTGTIAARLDPKLDPNGLQDNGGPTQTIALLPSSPAVDKGIANGLPTDQRGTGFSRTFNDPAIPAAAGGDNTDIGAFELQAPRLTSAGATLVNESCPPANGMIDPGENVTVNLNLLNNGGSSTNSLVATLQASNNVLVPSGPQTYGAIPAGGTVGRNFSFTANGNCGDVITLTLQLRDGVNNLGAVTYTFTLGCNTACAGAPHISSSTVLSCSSGNTVATITISNSGTVTANNVVLTTAKLGAISGTLLPQNIGDLAPGASATVTVTFTGAPSGATTLQVGGTYTGGSFNSSRRVTAPSC